MIHIGRRAGSLALILHPSYALENLSNAELPRSASITLYAGVFRSVLSADTLTDISSLLDHDGARDIRVEDNLRSRRSTRRMLGRILASRAVKPG